MDPNSVSYTVKELLAKMDERLERIESKLDSKAEAVSVVKLENRVALLESSQASRSATINFANRAWAIVIAVIALVLNIPAFLYFIHG